MVVDRCLSEDVVLQLVERRLDGSSLSEAEAHVDRCSACRQLVSELASGLTPSHDDSQASITQVDPALSDADATLHLPQGKVLNERFEIVRLLGRGGVGAVYEAKDLHLGVRVAIKILKPELSASSVMLEHLQQEIVLGRRITHPNACRIHDLGRCGELRFITMELVPGVDLRTALTKTPEQVEPVEVLLDICAALEAAHSSGVVHRDLKPSNVMLEPGGRAKVLDFGLARDVAQDQLPSRVGTPAYWSPEQARGEAATERSDIWAIGRIADELYERSQPVRTPSGMQNIIRRCLQPTPEDRFESVGALRAALLEVRSGSAWSPRAVMGLILALVGLMLALTLTLFVRGETSSVPGAAYRNQPSHEELAPSQADR